MKTVCYFCLILIKILIFQHILVKLPHKKFIKTVSVVLEILYADKRREKLKVKFSLEQAMKAQRESRGIALLFL